MFIKNLKQIPLANELIDKCIECGFCEIQCPSRHVTLTPRQRIVIYRELSALAEQGKQTLSDIKNSRKPLTIKVTLPALPMAYVLRHVRLALIPVY